MACPKSKSTKKPNNVEIVFEEHDFDGFLQKLNDYPSLKFLGNVVEHDWGQRVIRFYDLDGHLIEVGEEMKMIIERFISNGMTLEEVSKRMDVSVDDLQRLLN
nr:hypothetical protein [Phocaeicola vulgatus]